MAKFDIKDKAFRNLIEERGKFYGLKSDEFQKLNNAVYQYKKSNFFAKLFNVGDAKKAQKAFEELKADKYFKQVLTNYGFEFSPNGDIQKTEWYANQTKQGVAVDALLERPSQNQLGRSDDRSIGQYAQVPSQPQSLNYSQGSVQPTNNGPETLPPGQYHQVPSPQQVYAVPNTNVYSSADLALKTPQPPVHQQFGSQFPEPQKLQQTPQPQPQPQTTRADITKLFDVVRNNDVKGLEEIIKANASYVNTVRDTDGYSPLHFAPNKQIAEMLVKAGATVDAVAKDGSRPVDWAQNNPDLKQYLDAQGRQSQAQSAPSSQIYAVPENYGRLSLKPATGPDAPSDITRAVSAGGELNKFGKPQGGIYGGTDALSARDAEANKKAYEAELAQQRPASAPPVIYTQIHKTPINGSPQLSQQQYAGASSVQSQPLAPAKRQLPTPPATNVGSNKVSSDIAAKQATLFGGGRPVVGTGVATGRLSAAPKGSGLQK